MNLRRHTPHLVRHINRAEPLAVIPRRKPSVVRHSDGMVTVTMTALDAWRMYQDARADPHRYGFVYRYEEARGLPHESFESIYEPYDYDAMEPQA